MVWTPPHRKSRRWQYLAALVVLILLLQFPIFAPVRDLARRAVGYPAKVTASFFGGVGGFFKTIGSATKLGAENAALRAEVNQKDAEIAKLKTVEGDNAKLREDLKFSASRPDLKLLPAEIITYSPLGSYQAVSINRGARDGLKEEQAVVAQGYLIGKVKSVSENTAEIWLLANRNVITPVRLTSSQTSGILKGGIRGLVVDNIPIDTKVTKDELVVTSALEGLYPAGIAVGKVEEIISRSEEIFLAARISSPINVASIAQVFVIL